MKKFERNIKIGTNVKINDGWYVVTDVNDTRINIKVKKLAGSFQRGHISNYSNKIKKEN